MQKQASRTQKKSTLLEESRDFIITLFLILFFMFATVRIVDYSICAIPELNFLSINHCKIIKNTNIIIPYLFEKFKKGSKTNTKKACACATIITGLLSMNFTSSIIGLFNLIKSYNKSYSDNDNYGCYRVKGRSFRYRL
ncbi:hypothetical protein M9Y10_002218 [Tritrichomonas musculus]|uniref:Uncharacterized protein n=1 Tax=Tritrichomonas musculus TaxID=1915356 RepID=A0ABR2L964_9EUKA